MLMVVPISLELQLCQLDANGGADIATCFGKEILTSGRVTLAGAGGSITDSSNLTFDGSTLVTGTLNSTVDVQINGTSVVDTALNDAVAMAIALGYSKQMANTFKLKSKQTLELQQLEFIQFLPQQQLW